MLIKESLARADDLVSFCFNCSSELSHIKVFKKQCIESLKKFKETCDNIKQETHFGGGQCDNVIEFVREDNPTCTSAGEDSDFEWPTLEDKQHTSSQISSDSDSKPILELKCVKENTKIDNSQQPNKTNKKIHLKKKLKIRKQRSEEKNVKKKEKDKFCSVCSMSYTTTQIKHLLSAHGTKRQNMPEAESSKDGFLIECNICKKVLSDKKTFRAHFSLHSVLVQALKCNYCGKDFTDIGKYKYHMQKHEIPW